MKRWLWVLIICLLTGCQTSNETVTISVASSLQDVMTALIENYQITHPDAVINLNTGGSNTLKLQITQGFDVDLYISADPQDVQMLAEKQYVKKSQSFATNHVILVTNNDNITSLKDLALPDISMILAEDSVPIGKYGLEILTRYDEKEPDFLAKSLSNVVSYEQNVRQVVLKLGLKEADAGFVYETDLAVSTTHPLRVVPLPVDEQLMSSYELALLTEGSGNDEAVAFYEYLLSEKAKEVLVKYGFSVN